MELDQILEGVDVHFLGNIASEEDLAFKRGLKEGWGRGSRQTLAKVVKWLEEHNRTAAHLPALGLRLSSEDWQALKALSSANKP